MVVADVAACSCKAATTGTLSNASNAKVPARTRRASAE